jgi:very-short-patch-repair endonuclease
MGQDRKRDLRLTDLGYRIVRVAEGEVLNDLNNVIRSIEVHLPLEILINQSP